MPLKAAKKIERRNNRRMSQVELQAEVKASGLGVAQITNLRRMSREDLQRALSTDERELSLAQGVAAFASGDAASHRVRELGNRILYYKKLLQELA